MLGRVLLLSLVLLWGCTPPVEEPDPLPPKEEPVLIPTNGLSLEGTLTLPTRWPNDQLPALVLIHGSGPNDRDETMEGQLMMNFGFSIAVFAELARDMANAGFAVLRYDKRTCGVWNDCVNNYPSPDPDITIDTFIADADAAMAYLANRADIDADTIIAVGHSQGASFIPSLLEQNPQSPAGMMLGGPYDAIDAVIVEQITFIRDIMTQLGSTPAQIDARVATLETISDALGQMRAGTWSGASIGGASADFWQSWLDLGDALPTLVPTLAQGLLALSGDYDWNVPEHHTLDFEQLFAGIAPPPSHQAIVLPCLTHALNCIDEPDWTQITPDHIGTGIDPSVAATMSNFLASQGIDGYRLSPP